MKISTFFIQCNYRKKEGGLRKSSQFKLFKYRVFINYCDFFLACNVFFRTLLVTDKPSRVKAYKHYMLIARKNPQKDSTNTDRLRVWNISKNLRKNTKFNVCNSNDLLNPRNVFLE